LSRHQSRIEGHWSYGLFCTVTNTNVEILRWIREISRLGSVTPKKRYGKRDKPAFQWVLRVEEIPVFLPEVMPYLRIKLEQAELILKFIEGTRYTGPHHPMTWEEAMEKELIFKRMQELNMRGT
jgi:hypothetical protein